MEFWYSGEIDAAVAEAYSSTRKRVEAVLNERCAGESYGAGLTSIALIPIIRQSPHAERRLFQRASSSADYRLQVPYEQFLRGDAEAREQLLVRNTIQAVDDLARKARQSKVEFDGQRLRADILSAFGMTQNDLERMG
jgi:hypothetical protein